MSTDRFFEPAYRQRITPAILITGPSGAGKTLGALRLAAGMVGGDWSRVWHIPIGPKDARAYVGEFGIGRYRTLRAPLAPPYLPDRLIRVYQDAERAAIKAGGAIVVDDLSYVWKGSGGILEQVDRGGGGHAWNKWTPIYHELIQLLADPQVPTITIAKAKVKHILEETTTAEGKSSYGMREVGMSPILRPETEYEYRIRFSLRREDYHAEYVGPVGAVQDPDGWVELTSALGERIATWAETHEEDPQAPLQYGDGELVRIVSLEEVDAFTRYQTVEGGAPQSRAELRAWERDARKRATAGEVSRS